MALRVFDEQEMEAVRRVLDGRELCSTGGTVGRESE